MATTKSHFNLDIIKKLANEREKRRNTIIDRFMCENPDIEDKDLNWRLDGKLEWVCKHGAGHTVYSPDNKTLVHVCDGCCKHIILLQ